MSNKLPWTKWHWQDWLSDPALQMVSPCTRGIWANFLGYMDKDRTYFLSGTKQELTRLGACTVRDLDRFLGDVKKSAFCDVTKRHKTITIISRRLKREYEARESTRLRKKKQREKEGVTPLSQGEAEAEANTEAEAYTEMAKELKALCDELIEKLPRKYFHPWEFIEKTNGFPIECHIDLMERLLKNDSFMNQEARSGRAYAQTIFNIEAGNVQARLSEQEAEGHKE